MTISAVQSVVALYCLVAYGWYSKRLDDYCFNWFVGGRIRELFEASAKDVIHTDHYVEYLPYHVSMVTVR